MKKTFIVKALAFVLLLGGLSLGSILAKDVVFSDTENRYLARMPKLTWDNFIDGTFQSGLEEYLSDHLVFRKQFTAAKTAVSLATGNRDINGAYVGSDGYLFEKIVDTDIEEETFRTNVQELKNYFEQITEYVDEDCMSILLAPAPASVLEDYLPRDSAYFDQTPYFEKMKEEFWHYNFIDVRDVLTSKASEGVFYKTDHHWTSLGAYYAYTQWGRRTNHRILEQNRFHIEEECTDFRGSLYSKVLNVTAPYDTIVSYSGKDHHDYLVTKDGQTSDSFFDREKLEGTDKYAFFFGGNYAEVAIERLATEDINAAERNLLILKDSFANSFVPFVASEYDNIYMIDLRYYVGDMKDYVKTHEITDVLVLYSISNFITDNNIRKLAFTKVEEDGKDNPVQPDTEQPGEKPQEPVTYEQIATDFVPLVKGNLIVLNDRAFEFFAYKDDMAQKYADGLNALEKSLNGKARVYDLLVPLSSGITFPDAYWDEFDIGAQPYAILEMGHKLSSRIGYVNAYDILMRHRTEYLYFRTDHHWTALGAYYAYTAFCETKGIEAVPLEKYQTVTYEGFLGSLYREYNNEAMRNHPDYITAYLPISDCEMTSTDIYGKVTTEGILADGNTIPTADKYCVFIHGDNPYVDIHNKDLHDGSTCIVVKESFGNAFVPFLAEHYEHVIVIDYRYWNGNIAKLVDETGATDVLFVNNLYAIRNQYLLGKILGTIY